VAAGDGSGGLELVASRCDAGTCGGHCELRPRAPGPEGLLVLNATVSDLAQVQECVVRTDPGRDPGLRKSDVGDVGRDQGVMGPLFEFSVGDEEQDAEVRLLTLCSHRARLDR